MNTFIRVLQDMGLLAPTLPANITVNHCNMIPYRARCCKTTRQSNKHFSAILINRIINLCTTSNQCWILIQLSGRFDPLNWRPELLTHIPIKVLKAQAGSKLTEYLEKLHKTCESKLSNCFDKLTAIYHESKGWEECMFPYRQKSFDSPTQDTRTNSKVKIKLKSHH